MIHNKYFEIMKQFLKGYDNEIYGRELIGKIRMSQKNIALTLKELEKKGVLTSRKKGNTKYYSLNKLNPLIKKYILVAEIKKSLDFFNKHRKLMYLFDKINFSNAIVGIFGSFAKGIEKKDSDLDLFIIGDIDEKEIKRKSKDYMVNISIKSTSKKDFEYMLKEKNPFISEILENHVIITGFEEFIEKVVKSKW